MQFLLALFSSNVTTDLERCLDTKYSQIQFDRPNVHAGGLGEKDRQTARVVRGKPLSLKVGAQLLSRPAEQQVKGMRPSLQELPSQLLLWGAKSQDTRDWLLKVRSAQPSVTT